LLALASGAGKGHLAGFLAVLTQYPNFFKAADFTACASARENKGKNALWFLAAGVVNGHPEGLLAVLEQYPNAFKTEDFIACLEEGNDKGKNAIGFLVDGADQGHPECLRMVLTQYPVLGVELKNSSIIASEEPEMADLSKGLAELVIAEETTVAPCPILNQFQNNLSLQIADEVEDCSPRVSPRFTKGC
jgi:hypothetical protein